MLQIKDFSRRKTPINGICLRDGEPSVYVGTYSKYNEGSLCGLWIDLSSFNSYDDFIDFCKAIHADEYDPELTAQDYEGFLLRKRLRDNPRQWYNEGFISEDDFDHILEMKFAEYRLNNLNMKQYSDMCDSSRSALLAKNHGQDAVDDYMEFEDSLDNFEAIALALGYAKNPTAASGIAKKTSPGTSSRNATTSKR